jgi:protein-disulfide isomerase
MYTPGYVEPETPGEQTRREKACAFFATSEAECDEGIGEWRMPLVYEVIEPSGRYLGLSFPNRQTELGFARGRHVWVVETGAFGESYVVRYRIAGGVEKAGQPPPARPMVKNLLAASTFPTARSARRRRRAIRSPLRCSAERSYVQGGKYDFFPAHRMCGPFGMRRGCPMRRALAYAALIAILILPASVGAQEAAAAEGRPWWLEALIFIVSLPYTLYMVFVDGQRLHLLPAPLVAIWLCLSSFREWRRQRFWTPRVVHVLAVLGLATIVMINVAWVRAGGEMWTQRYVVIAIFGLFPYVVYLVLRGPKLLGRQRADGSGVTSTVLLDGDKSPADARSGAITGSRFALRALGLIGVAAAGLVVAAGSSGPASAERPELAALHAPESVVPLARGVAKGDPEAPFTIVAFGDYQCPACARFARRVQGQLDSAYVATGEAEFVFFDLPLTFLHSNAFAAALAARCAEDQGRFWDYQDELYRTQEQWSSLTAPHHAFEEAAATVGLDRVTFRSCLDSERHSDVVEANLKLARELGIRSTPTIVVSRNGGDVREVNRNSFRFIARTLEEMEAGTLAK